MTDQLQPVRCRAVFSDDLPMTKAELNDMPKALRLIADGIKAPDHVPTMCLRDAAAMIESLRWAIETTIMENLHLADGDNCTLKRLKDAVSFSLPSENKELADQRA